MLDDAYQNLSDQFVLVSGQLPTKAVTFRFNF